MDTNKINMLKIGSKAPSLKELPAKIKKMFKEWRRVYKITKKPSKEEFVSIVKVTGLGIIIIGALGFMIFMVVELIS